MKPFLATIMGWAPNFAPRGWAFCWGQILSIAQNTALFSLLGTTYGGNGQTTFALPNLASRLPIGTGQGESLTEGVHLLALPERTRDVLCALVQHLVSLPNANWVQVSVGDGQGWPLPQWLDGGPDCGGASDARLPLNAWPPREGFSVAGRPGPDYPRRHGRRDPDPVRDRGRRPVRR